MSNRAGGFITNLSGDAAYRSFAPAALPPQPPLAFDDEAIEVLVNANKQIAILESVTTRFPNVNLFVAMYVRKEALLSSQIEGIQATLEDVFDPLLDDNANRDAAEVINYIKATEFAIGRLRELPLCNRLIRETMSNGLNSSCGRYMNQRLTRFRPAINLSRCTIRPPALLPDGDARPGPPPRF